MALAIGVSSSRWIARLSGLAQFLLPEAVEDDGFIEAIEELGAEVTPQGLIHPRLHLRVAGGIARQIQDRLAADGPGEDQHRVGEIHRAALPVGDAAVIEDLQHHVEHIGVGLHLVEQDHRVGSAPHCFCELAALLVEQQGVAQGKVAVRKLPPQLTLRATARPLLSRLVRLAPESVRYRGVARSGT